MKSEDTTGSSLTEKPSNEDIILMEELIEACKMGIEYLRRENIWTSAISYMEKTVKQAENRIQEVNKNG